MLVAAADVVESGAALDGLVLVETVLGELEELREDDRDGVAVDV